MSATPSPGQLLRRARLDMGLSQAALATTMGCGATYIAEIETGITLMKDAFRTRLEEELGSLDGGNRMSSDWQPPAKTKAHRIQMLRSAPTEIELKDMPVRPQFICVGCHGRFEVQKFGIRICTTCAERHVMKAAE